MKYSKAKKIYSNLLDQPIPYSTSQILEALSILFPATYRHYRKL